MICVQHTDKKGVAWYLHKAISKNKKTLLYHMKKTKEGMISVDDKWLMEYEIIQGTNCPLIKKRRKLK